MVLPEYHCVLCFSQSVQLKTALQDHFNNHGQKCDVELLKQGLYCLVFHCWQ